MKTSPSSRKSNSTSQTLSSDSTLPCTRHDKNLVTFPAKEVAPMILISPCFFLFLTLHGFICFSAFYIYTQRKENVTMLFWSVLHRTLLHAAHMKVNSGCLRGSFSLDD